MAKPDGNYVDQDGDLVWVENGSYHRLDGPAIIFADGGGFHWRRRGGFHCEVGPALEYLSGKPGWFLDNTKYTFDKWLIATPGLSAEEKVMLKLKYG